MLTGPVRIVAPASSVAQAEAAIAAGADELYCGVLLDDWIEVFGDTDVLSRRQGRQAHVRTLEELAAIARLGTSTAHSVALTLNARYSAAQERLVLELARVWEEIGGRAAVVGDPALLADLRRRGSGLDLHLSLLAGVFNAASAGLFASLGVTRIVLPRDLDIDEMAAIVAGAPGIRYEALAFHQKCRFIDGMCGFYHGVHVPAGVPADFAYEASPGSTLGLAWSADPAYEGHGCEIPWWSDDSPVRPLHRDDFGAPHCAACQIAGLARAGVRHLKVAGRGFPAALVARAVRFLRGAIDAWETAPTEHDACATIRRAYGSTFSSRCDASRCYYRTDGGCRR